MSTLVVVGAFVTAAALVYQGREMLRSWQGTVFLASTRGRERPGVALAILFVVWSGVVAIAVVRGAGWRDANLEILLVTTALLSVGALSVLSPASFARWTFRDRPELRDDPRVPPGIRFLGVAFTAIGAFVIAWLVVS